ncbi:MAG: hypothetical protein GX409_03860 [candidate division Zixibacteria bacterium]|nr:hypothetical protein [candidate division Zixibacteria bacterium]
MNTDRSDKKNILRGALHVHTKLSHDGMLGLDELAKFFREHGYDFVAVTEHSYDISQQSIDELAGECERLSAPDFLIIAGIEFRCHDNIDILGYGVTRTCDSDDPATVIKHIQSCGGVAVFAHPTVRDYPIEKEWVRLLDGAEIWNRQEGKYLPQVVSMEKFRLFQRWHPKIKAFCGLDFHRKKSYYPVANMVAAEVNDRELILKAFRDGKFYAESPYFNIGSDGKINWFKRYAIYFLSSILNIIRNTRESFSQ